jgi:uncharacterized repeat protein (TIGR01451 family)
MRIAPLIALLAAIALVAPASAAASGPNLRTTIGDSPDPVAAGDSIYYTIGLQNNGTAAAQNVSLKAQVPAGTTFTGFSGDGSWMLSAPDGAGKVTATKASVAAGASAQFTLQVTVDPPTPSGTTIKGSASVSSSPADSFPRDNGASTTTTVERVALAVADADSPDPVAPGHDITYYLGLVNTGKANASGVGVADVLPPGTTFVSAAAPAGWFVNSPPVGGTGTVSFFAPSTPAKYGLSFSLTVHVDPGTAEGTTISDTVSVTTHSAEDDTSDNSATATTLVSSKADLDTAMTVLPSGAADPDTDLTYSVSVINRGDVNASDVALSDVVPAGTTFVSATQTQGVPFACSAPAAGQTGTIDCSRTTLAHNEYGIFTVVLHVRADAAGATIANTASAATSTPDLNPANDSATKSTPVTGSGSGSGSGSGTGTPPPPSPPGGGGADLAVVKPAKPARVRHGHKLAVRVHVLNRGNAVARVARLTVRLPKRLTLVKAKGCTVKKRHVTCALGDLAASGRSTVKLVVRPQRRGTYKLKARATSAAPDAHPADNAATLKLKAR